MNIIINDFGVHMHAFLLLLEWHCWALGYVYVQLQQIMPKNFPEKNANFYFHQQCVKVPGNSFIFSQSSGYTTVFYCGFNLYLPVD
jgi:hypothetical protein